MNDLETALAALGSGEHLPMPKRIQMSRQHAWRAENAGAIIVARPRPLGNPFRIYQHCKPGKREDSTRHPGDWGIEDTGRFNNTYLHGYTKLGAARMACTMYRQALDDVYPPGSTARLLLIHELAGHDLACWCPLLDPTTEQRWPCHADILLALANLGWTPETEGTE